MLSPVPPTATVLVLVKFEPETVSVSGCEPAATFMGLIELMAGVVTVVVVPPPPLLLLGLPAQPVSRPAGPKVNEPMCNYLRWYREMSRHLTSGHLLLAMCEPHLWCDTPNFSKSLKERIRTSRVRAATIQMRTAY